MFKIIYEVDEDEDQEMHNKIREIKFKNSKIYLKDESQLQNEKEKFSLTNFIDRDEREVLKH